MKPDKIESFRINHDLLCEGIYVSRIDGDIVTYDLRTRRPNMGDYMDAVTMHSVEHMIATYIRSSSIGESVIYFGPMGCRTGFYLLVRDCIEKEKVLSVLKDVLRLVINHKGEVFGASRIECGNYRELDLAKAQKECEQYLLALENKENDFCYRS